MEGGSVDELLGVTVEGPVLDQLQVEVGRTLEDRVQPGLTGDDWEERHLQAVDQAGGAGAGSLGDPGAVPDGGEGRLD